MSKKIQLTDIESIPTYFKFNGDYFKLNKDTYIKVSKCSYGYDIQTFETEDLEYYILEIVEPITKAEFVAYCNKAYKAITGFKHVEELWKDEEGDTHE